MPISDHIAEQHIIGMALRVRGSELYKEPLNVADLPIGLQQAFAELLQKQLVLPERYLVRFKRVNVSSHGIIFRNLAIYIPSLVYHTLVNEYKGRLLFKQWIGKTVGGEQCQELGLVFDHWGTINYYHWVVESLPRLLVLQQARPDCVLLLPAGVPQYIRDTIALFGFERILELAVGQVIEARNLWFVGHPGNFWLQDAQLLQRVQMRVKSCFHLTKEPAYRRVYISRSRAAYRKLANEEEVLALVITAGFDVYYFEEMTFAQQVELMHETQILLAQHGASLTNLLWMQPNSIVIELLNEAAPNLAFFKLAGQCDVNYYCLACANVGEEPANNSNVLVDTEALQAIMRQVAT